MKTGKEKEARKMKENRIGIGRKTQSERDRECKKEI